MVLQAIADVFAAVLEKGGSVEMSCSMILDEARTSAPRLFTIHYLLALAIMCCLLLAYCLLYLCPRQTMTDLLKQDPPAGTPATSDTAAGSAAAGALLEDLLWRPAEHARAAMLLLQYALKTRNVRMGR